MNLIVSALANEKRAYWIFEGREKSQRIIISKIEAYNQVVATLVLRFLGAWLGASKTKTRILELNYVLHSLTNWLLVLSESVSSPLKTESTCGSSYLH